MMAHYGVVGLVLYGWFIFVVARMARQLVGWAKGHELSALVWAMIATMMGYWAWSFVEFSFDDKPFWEFLALFTVLWTLFARASRD